MAAIAWSGSSSTRSSTPRSSAPASPITTPTPSPRSRWNSPRRRSARYRSPPAALCGAPDRAPPHGLDRRPESSVGNDRAARLTIAPGAEAATTLVICVAVSVRLARRDLGRRGGVHQLVTANAVLRRGARSGACCRSTPLVSQVHPRIVCARRQSQPAMRESSHDRSRIEQWMVGIVRMFGGGWRWMPGSVRKCTVALIRLAPGPRGAG